jgi:hypothetical protein
MKSPSILLVLGLFTSLAPVFSQNSVLDSLDLRADNTPSVQQVISDKEKAITIVETVNSLMDSTAVSLKTAIIPRILDKGKTLTVDEKANPLVDSTTKLLKTPTIPSLPKTLLQDLFYQLALNFDLSRGNQNYANFLPQLGFGFENPLVGLNSNMLYNFARLNGKLLNSDLVARNALIFLPKSKLPIQLLGGGETSKIRNLPSRYQTGLGVVFNLLKKEHHTIRAGINGVFDRSRYVGSSFKNDPEQTSNIRTVLGPLFQLVGHHTLKEGRVLFTYDLSALRAMNHKKDYRFNAISALSFPILKGISLRSSLIYSHESVILQNTKHGDLFLTMGVGVGRF